MSVPNDTLMNMLKLKGGVGVGWVGGVDVINKLSFLWGCHLKRKRFIAIPIYLQLLNCMFKLKLWLEN